VSAGDGESSWPHLELGALYGPLFRAEVAQAVSKVRGGAGSVILTLNGQAVAAVIPPEDLHEPGTCCCKNCPWGGEHQPGRQRPDS
jgi:hypothetical protein